MDYRQGNEVSPEDIVADNADVNVEVTGKWSHSTVVTGFLGLDYLFFGKIVLFSPDPVNLNDEMV